jgi:WD40 repeat protein
MFKQAIREMKQSIGEVTKETAKVLANEKRTARELANNQREAGQWQRKAEQAVAAGDDGLPRKTLSRKQEHQKLATALECSRIRARFIARRDRMRIVGGPVWFLLAAVCGGGCSEKDAPRSGGGSPPAAADPAPRASISASPQHSAHGPEADVSARQQAEPRNEVKSSQPAAPKTAVASGSVRARVGTARRPADRPNTFATLAGSGRCAFRPETNELVTAGAGAVRVWDADSETEKDRFLDTPSFIISDMTPDGRLLALPDNGGGIAVWNLVTKERQHLLKVPVSEEVLRFSPEGRMLAAIEPVSGQRAIVRLWNLTQDRPTAIPFPEDKDVPIVNLVFSPDGRSIASLTRSQPGHAAGVDLWDRHSRAHLSSIPFEKFEPDTLEFSPDSRRLVIGGADAGVPVKYRSDRVSMRVVDVDAAKITATLRGHTARIWALLFAHGGRVLISSSEDRTIRFWDTEYGIEFATLVGHNNIVWRLTLGRAGEVLYSSDLNSVIRHWDIPLAALDSRVQSHLLDYRFPDWALGLHAGRRVLAACDHNGAILWNAADDYATGVSLQSHACASVRGMAFSRDDALFASAGLDLERRVGEIVIWDTATGSMRQRLDADDLDPMRVAFSPDARTLAVGNANGEIVLWDLKTGRPWPWGRLREHAGIVMCLGFSPDGRTLISASNDLSFKIWDLPTNPESAQKTLISRRTGRASANFGFEIAAFSADARAFLVTTNGMTEIWDVESMQKRLAVPGLMAAFVGDGSRFVTASGQHLRNEARLWETDSGKELARMQGGHSDFISVVAPSPDGKNLFTASRDHTIRCWSLDTGEEVHDLSSLPVRADDAKDSTWRLFDGPPPDDINRVVAQWAVDHGGAAAVIAGGRQFEIPNAGTLPLGPLLLRGIDLTNCRRVESGDLLPLTRLGDLRSLKFGSSTSITNEALTHLTGIKSLQHLTIRSASGISEAAIKTLKSALPVCEID